MNNKRYSVLNIKCPEYIDNVDNIVREEEK